jgi:predicted nucleic acid-binding protein
VTAEQYRYPYLDSSVFIAWLKGEVVKDVDRKDVADHILRSAERGTFRICISALTLAEVHKKRGHERLTEEEHTEILRFFEHDYIDVILVDRMIGEQAHIFCREYALSPADGIHLACALRGNCDILLSWDDALNAVSHPRIRCAEPRVIGQMKLDLENDTDQNA